MTGHLDLVCGLDESGRSVLREQSFRAPMHISKPHYEGDTLVVNVINPTAGLFAGDVLRWRVKVESGGRLLLTSPSATRSHRMPDGEAQSEQTFSVASGGFLEVFPELFIPQRETRYRQATRIDVATDGELMFWETLAPGRVAANEAFVFTRLDWMTEVFLEGMKIVRERYALAPGDGSLAALHTLFPVSYYASAFAIGPAFEGDIPAESIATCMAGLQIGCSRLARGGWVVKMLAVDSIALRRGVAAVRAQLYSALDRSPIALRRV